MNHTLILNKLMSRCFFPSSGMPQMHWRTQSPEDTYERMQSFSRQKEQIWVGHRWRDGREGWEEGSEEKSYCASVSRLLH